MKQTERQDGVKRSDVIIQTVQQHLDGNFNAKSGKTAPELMAFRFVFEHFLTFVGVTIG